MSDTSTDSVAWQDPVVAEVRAAREALFAAAGYDIREFCRRARAAQGDSGHPVVTLGARGTSERSPVTVEPSQNRDG